jgi:hypothetical protein
MKEADRLGLSMDATEALEKRTPTSKTYDLGNGKYRLKTASSLLHYHTANGLEDIDLEPVDMGTYWQIDKAPYIVTIDKDRARITYRGKASGLEIDMELQNVDNQTPSVTGEVVDGKIRYSGISNNDLDIIITPSGISTERTIHSAAGRKRLGWKVKQNSPNPVITETKRSGKDNAGNKPQISIERSSLSPIEGRWEHTFEEHVTGKILVKDPETRRETAIDAVQYPVKVKS